MGSAGLPAAALGSQGIVFLTDLLLPHDVTRDHLVWFAAISLSGWLSGVANKTMLDLPLELLSSALLCLTGLPWWLFEFWSWAQFTYLAAMLLLQLFTALRRRPTRIDRAIIRPAAMTALCLSLLPLATADQFLFHPFDRVVSDSLPTRDHRPGL